MTDGSFNNNGQSFRNSIVTPEHHGNDCYFLIEHCSHLSKMDWNTIAYTICFFGNTIAYEIGSNVAKFQIIEHDQIGTIKQ